MIDSIDIIIPHLLRSVFWKLEGFSSSQDAVDEDADGDVAGAADSVTHL